MNKQVLRILEIHRQAMVQRRREEVDVGLPPTQELRHSLRTQCPFGAEDLRAAAERIRQNIQMSGNEVGKKSN